MLAYIVYKDFLIGAGGRKLTLTWLVAKAVTKQSLLPQQVASVRAESW